MHSSIKKFILKSLVLLIYLTNFGLLHAKKASLSVQHKTSSASQEIKKLVDGNKQFHDKYFAPSSPYKSFYNKLVVEGQNPKIMLISCSDSRVDPSMIFNCLPGELFVVRNVANLVPPYQSDGAYHGTSAALEYGVNALEVNHIIILGHTQCGGIQSLFNATDQLKKEKSDSFITKWMELARPAYEKVTTKYGSESLKTKTTLCEQYTLVNSLNNLKTFPWIQKRIKEGKLQIHAWYFDLATGTIHMYNQQKKNWSSL
ncbi:MAG: carbonic anhydrase [Candidatus Dependentiae bacterium]|nr:carbonic anhydrase [Candidatus Dependentiae bacterium]